MKVLNQEQYKSYRKKLADDGFLVYETTSIFPSEETYRILEERIGPMPWNLLKIDGDNKGQDYENKNRAASGNQNHRRQ